MLEDFIDHNNLEFTKGRRNSDIVMLCGYALHKKVKKEKVEHAISVYAELDDELLAEFERVYDYAEANNYGKWWTNPGNKKAVTSFTPVTDKSK
jgi:hypothetical protein